MTFSQGRTTYVGGWANPAMLDQIVSDALSAAGIAHAELHQDLRIRDNGPWRYVFNYGPQAVDISELTGGKPLLLGEPMLGSCNIALFRR